MKTDIILQQVKLRGYLSLQDSRELSNIGVPILYILTKFLEKSPIDIAQEIKDGLVSYETVLNAIQNQERQQRFKAWYKANAGRTLVPYEQLTEEDKYKWANSFSFSLYHLGVVSNTLKNAIIKSLGFIPKS